MASGLQSQVGASRAGEGGDDVAEAERRGGGERKDPRVASLKDEQQAGKILWLKKQQWVETNPSNVRIFLTDICILPTDIHFIAA